MRYVAQRIRTGEWLHRNLPLSGVERTRELSGPGQITGTVLNGLERQVAEDGLPVLDAWSTAVYAVNDDDRITQGGIVVPSVSYDNDDTAITVAGFSAFAQGFPYTDAFNWGPFVDPVQIYRDHWEWIQRQPQSDLGLEIVGAAASSVRVGTNEEPYRLSFVDQPDLGQEMDSLAGQTPFDYVEEHAWSGPQREVVRRTIRLGVPRVGRDRVDLRLVESENVVARPSVKTAEGYANDVIGIGNGEGAAMVYSRASIDDGRLRRTKYITDKTVTRQSHMDDIVRRHLMRLGNRLEVDAVSVVDHDNAPLSEIGLGDDLDLVFLQPGFGTQRIKVRVLSITENDDTPGLAALGTARADSFLYSATIEGV